MAFNDVALDDHFRDLFPYHTDLHPLSGCLNSPPREPINPFENIIENVEYSSKDVRGNEYLITAKEGEIDINDNSIIKLKVEDRDQLALVSLDSCSRAFDSSIELIIKKADFRITLIEPQGNSFTSTIRHKLMWGIDKRN